jgi:GMP synthase (glutamine-hydrolysing)
MKILVIDNGGQWTHREWRVLKYLKVDTKIIPNTTTFEEIGDVDGLILSGGSPSVAAENERMGNNGNYLDKADYPILGICAGMQFMCTHFGGSIGPALKPEFGKATLHVTEDGDLFNDLPKQFTVWQSHNDEVKVLPDVFQILAHSDSCPIEAVRHRKKPYYAVQFHPEVENTEHGYDIFKNFLKVVERWNN